jgi:hypothetical protein
LCRSVRPRDEIGTRSTPHRDLVQPAVLGRWIPHKVDRLVSTNG